MVKLTNGWIPHQVYTQLQPSLTEEGTAFEAGLVLAQNPLGDCQWGVWVMAKNSEGEWDCYGGHYFDADKVAEARADFGRRLAENCYGATLVAIRETR